MNALLLNYEFQMKVAGVGLLQLGTSCLSIRYDLGRKLTQQVDSVPVGINSSVSSLQGICGQAGHCFLHRSMRDQSSFKHREVGDVSNLDVSIRFRVEDSPKR